MNRHLFVAVNAFVAAFMLLRIAFYSSSTLPADVVSDLLRTALLVLRQLIRQIEVMNENEVLAVCEGQPWRADHGWLFGKEGILPDVDIESSLLSSFVRVLPVVLEVLRHIVVLVKLDGRGRPFKAKAIPGHELPQNT